MPSKRRRAQAVRASQKPNPRTEGVQAATPQEANTNCQGNGQVQGLLQSGDSRPDQCETCAEKHRQRRRKDDANRRAKAKQAKDLVRATALEEKTAGADLPNAGIARTRHAPARPDVSAVPSGTTNIEGGAKPKKAPRLNISCRARSRGTYRHGDNGASRRSCRGNSQCCRSAFSARNINSYPYFGTIGFLTILRVGRQAEEGTALRL